jgi:hypothetical protein
VPHEIHTNTPAEAGGMKGTCTQYDDRSDYDKISVARIQLDGIVLPGMDGVQGNHLKFDF